MFCLLLTSLVLAATPHTVLPNGEASPPEAEQVAPKGTIVFDARVPAEVLIDGTIQAQLFNPAELKVRAPVGLRQLVIMRNGTPEKLQVDVPAVGTALVLVGRNGTSTGHNESLSSDSEAEALGPIEIRVLGNDPLQLRVADKRIRLFPGENVEVMLPAGVHELSLRNASGTAIFATGTLHVGAPHPSSIIQVAGGRMPETSGGITFQSAR